MTECKVNTQTQDIFSGLWVENPQEWVNHIMKFVKSANGLDEIEHKTRKSEHKEARQWHIFLANAILGWPYARAGGLYGKDHATAMHAKRTILNLVEVDKFFKEKYADVIRECKEYNSRIFI